VKEIGALGDECGVLAIQPETLAPASSEADVDSAAEVVGVEALFRAHARFVANFVVRMGVAPDEVDDVIQDVFLTAHRKGGYVSGPARPTTWLAEIALRVVLTHKRSSRRRRVTPDHAALVAAVSSAEQPDETLEHRDALSRVERALDTIAVDRRAVFVLFEIEGESCEAIAGGLGIPIGTVYSRLHAARREFQRAFDRVSNARPRLPKNGKAPR